MFETANCEKQMKPILSGICFKLCLNCKGCPTCVSNCVKTSHISDSNCHLVAHRLSPVFCLKPHLMGIKASKFKICVFTDLVLSQDQTSHSSRSWRQKWLTGQMSNCECPQFSHFWIFRPERPTFNWGRPRIQIKPLKFSLSSFSFGSHNSLLFLSHKNHRIMSVSPPNLHFKTKKTFCWAF